MGRQPAAPCSATLLTLVLVGAEMFEGGMGGVLLFVLC